MSAPVTPDAAEVAVRTPGMKVEVRACAVADGNVECAVEVNGQKVCLTFTGTDILVDFAGG